MAVIHMDGNRNNLCVDNLQWQIVPTAGRNSIPTSNKFNERTESINVDVTPEVAQYLAEFVHDAGQLVDSQVRKTKAFVLFCESRMDEV